MKKLLLVAASIISISEAGWAQNKSQQSRYFVIQNIATEKTRVYERCTETPNCPHRLIFEADTVVGRPEEGPDFKTWVGHGKISQWIKFYQDGAGKYPHWYRAGQNLNTIPPKAPRNSKGQPEYSLSWGSKWKVNYKGHTSIYGAFGWYAAKLTPESSVGYQWMHGTMGWGSDGDAAIQLTRSTLLNIFSNPGSSGCTRLSNANIAYLRHILPVGTDVYRVYARESTREVYCSSYSWNGTCKRLNTLSRYAQQTQPKAWDFLMLTDGAQKTNGLTADAATILAQGLKVVPGVNLIEKGTAYIDQYPTPVQPNYTHLPSSGLTGDRYEIDDAYGRNPTKFRGHFLVDEGRFINYAHPHAPKKVIIGGTAEFRKTVPDYLRTSGSHNPPEIIYNTSLPNGELGG